MAIIPLAFGIGYRKDYQLDTWVAWLGRALSESEGGRFVDEAAWLARLITTVEPMTEGAPGSAAADLPARVVPAHATAAVRIFEYLVRHGTVGHLDALAALVTALLKQAGSDEPLPVELAADITGELLAPAANRAYPELASTLVEAAQRAGGSEKARALAESLATRTDAYALPTTRAEWRRGLGLPGGSGKRPGAGSEESSDDYDALALSDGERIPRSKVGSLIQTVDDVVALRAREAHDSHFRWDLVVFR